MKDSNPATSPQLEEESSDISDQTSFQQALDQVNEIIKILWIVSFLWLIGICFLAAQPPRWGFKGGGEKI